MSGKNNDVSNSKMITYRYLFTRACDEEGMICVKIITDVEDGHKKVIDQIKKDPSIMRCMREYVCEYDASLFASVDAIKQSVPNLKTEVDNNA